MVKFSSVVLMAVAAGCHVGHVSAFVPPSTNVVNAAASKTTTSSSTSLFIIGPMIKKMREEEAKKKMPMANPEEAAQEAPGLRVGTGAWKWPPIWPYDKDFFIRKSELEESTNALSNVQELLGGGGGGMPSMPTSTTQKEEMNVMEYWQREVGDIQTELDPAAVEKLKSHYSYYLRDGMSVLELGAAENSYLPEELKLSRHVGVGANQALMDLNPSLTETLVVDLNDVEPGQVVNSNELKALSSGTELFDVVIMANTIDFLTNPREVFRTAWLLLKPGGTMMVPFAAKDAYSDKFQKAQTKMWTDMTNDQHMWICGSFFQFSAGDGWEFLKGFDISPEGAQEDNTGMFANLLPQQGKPINMYVVQATKGYQDETIDQENPIKSFSSKMWMLPTMEERDKFLVAPRLARVYQAASTQSEKDAVVQHLEVLPKVYESLLKMDVFAFDFSLQAQLAANLIADPDFCGNDEQINSLKQGLGLRKPSADFWAPVGEATAKMNGEDKVNLLAHIVPRFGSGDEAQEEALQSFVTGLKPTFAVIREKSPNMNEADVQLLGTELLASEILKPGLSSRKEFASWLQALTEQELLDMLETRKSFKQKAAQELADYKDEKANREKDLEELRKKMDEQVQKARKERTMAFDPETGKMREIQK